MKNILLFILFSLTISISYSSDCVDSDGKDIHEDGDLIIKEISRIKNCYRAVDLAKNCSWGATRDVGTVIAASEVCEKKFKKNKPSPILHGYQQIMVNACNNHYENLEGTIYLSLNAYCKLDALLFVYKLSEAALEAEF
ncbi:hypothetical protein N9N67_10025 [Bacteriovoracaceae bacterium]|nr:hypothetical protein [Bacteriovoracaceae bacterium]